MLDMDEIRMNEKEKESIVEDTNKKSSEKNKKEAATEKSSEQRSVDLNEDEEQVDQSRFKLSPDDLLIDRDWYSSFINLIQIIILIFI